MIEQLLISGGKHFKDMPYNENYTLYGSDRQYKWVITYWNIHLSFHGVNRVRKEMDDNFKYITLMSC